MILANTMSHLGAGHSKENLELLRSFLYYDGERE